MCFCACNTDATIDSSSQKNPSSTSQNKGKVENGLKKQQEIRNNNIHVLINRLKQQCFLSHRGEVILQMEINQNGEVIKNTFIKAKQNNNEKLDAAIECGESIIKEMKRKFGEIKHMSDSDSKPKNETYTFPL